MAGKHTNTTPPPRRVIADRVKRGIKKILSVVLSLLDKRVPKNDRYWIFPVYFIGEGHFTDNVLAVFEEVKNDPSIKKILLRRRADLSVEGKNVVILPMRSPLAVWYLLRSGVFFVQHSVWLDFAEARYQIVDPLDRKIINLWHGIPIKDISHRNTGIVNERALREMENYRIIASSENDCRNMQKAFFKTPPDRFWITGLPRNDFLVREERRLPEICRKDIKAIRSLCGDKKLILYAPTYRETNEEGAEHYNFNDKELERLEEWLRANNAAMGVRYHPYRRPKSYEKMLRREHFIDLSDEIIADVRNAIRMAEIVITDYSSLYVDALYISKRCISFAYDYEHYLQKQRGFFFDFKKVFPGPICKDFDALLQALEETKKTLCEKEQAKITSLQKLFFKYLDEGNALRVADRVRELIG